jgi:type II secretory pathway component PulC
MLGLLLATAVTAAPADLTAIGVVVSPRADACVAILRAGGRSRVVAPGDTAFGGRVAVITPTGVVLDFEDGRRELRLAPPESSAALAPAAAAAAPRDSETQEDPTASTRSLERHEVERRLSEEIPRILAETTLLPVTNGAQTVGFTLSRIPEGTLLTDAGLQPGDVLTQINDVPIDGLPTLIGLWPQLQTASTLRAQVIRNGRPVSLTVTLR